MILDEYVEVKYIPKYRKYYENLGYVFPKHNMGRRRRDKDTGKLTEYAYDSDGTIMVKVNDLLPTSRVEINVSCDRCSAKDTTIFLNYKNQIDNKGEYLCRDCLKVFKSDLIKKVSWTEEVAEKRKNTMIERYGVCYPFESEEIKNKAKETTLKHYGVEYSLQVEEVREKSKQTCLEKYGTTNPNQSEEVRRKYRETCIEKYGVPHSVLSDEKIDEMLKKRAKSKYMLNNAPLSKQQIYLSELFNGKLNYPLGKLNLDILYDNIDIEYDGSGHNLRVKMGDISQEEFDKKEKNRKYFIINNNYKVMTIVSRKDYLPSDEVLLNMFDISKKYLNSHTWITWDIDNQIFLNSEHPNGCSFYYGNLRQLKAS